MLLKQLSIKNNTQNNLKIINVLTLKKSYTTKIPLQFKKKKKEKRLQLHPWLSQKSKRYKEMNNITVNKNEN